MANPSSDWLTLPISEIASGARRLEAESYLSDGFMLRRQFRRSTLRSPRLGALANIWQPNRLKGIQVDSEHGIPFLTATQVFDIWPTPRKWLAASKIKDLQDYLVTPGKMLVTRSGTVGNTIVTYSAHSDQVISDDLLRVEIEDPLLMSYVYTFLRTKFGRALMRSSQYGSVIKHLETGHLAEIPIPTIEGPLVDEIGGAIAETYRMRSEAHKLDMLSRSTFASAMWDHPGTVPHVEGFVVSASSLFDCRRRLEANAYGPSSQIIAEVYKRNAKTVDTLGQIAKVFATGRFKHIYGEGGTPYLDSEPIFKVNPELTKFLMPATKIDFGAYTVKRGWLLMARSGQIYGINGQTILANEWHEGKVVSDHIVRIIPDREAIRPGYLQTVLSHPTLGKPLVVSRAYGTSVPELATEDIEQLPIPRLANELEDQIAEAAEQASKLRRNADELEDSAVTKLEVQLSSKLAVVPNQMERGSVRISEVA